MLDEWLYGKPTVPLVSRDKYWENFYSYKDDNDTKFDVYMSFLQSFARLTANSLSSESGCRFLPIWKVKEATYLRVNDTFEGVLAVFEMKVMENSIQRDFISLEAFFKPKVYMKLFNRNMTEPASRLKSLIVSCFSLYCTGLCV